MQEKQFQTERNLNTANEELEKTIISLKQVQLNIEDVNSQLEKEKQINIVSTDRISILEIKQSESLNTLEEKSIEISNLKEHLKKLEELQMNDILMKEKSNFEDLQKIKLKFDSEQSALRWSLEESNKNMLSINEEKNQLKVNLQTRDLKIQELEKQIEQINSMKIELANCVETLKTEVIVTKDNDLKLAQNLLNKKDLEINELSKKKSILEETANSLEIEMERLKIDFNEKLNANFGNIQALTFSFEREKNELVDKNHALENEEQNLRELLAKKNNELNEITLKIRSEDDLEKLLEERDIQINALNETIKSRDKESERNMQNLLEKLNLVSSESAQLLDTKNQL